MIFVHGLGQDSSIFDHLIAGLAARGVPRDCLHALDYSDGNLAIAQAAEQELAPYVERLLAAHPASGAMSARVNLVGHSMGALSSRWYAARLRPDRVRTWISTSGANHGTNWKCPQPDGTGHGDMCPAFARNAGDSAVQIALNGGPEPDVDESPYGLGRDSAGAQHVAPDATRSILYLTVQVSRDPYIVPAASLRLDGAGGLTLQLPARAPWRELAPGNFRYTEPSGHDEVLRSDALVDFIYLAISATRPEPGATTSTSDSVHRTWHSPQSS
ncbi:MAG TPA: alpha/beta fold hydrolase [Steroidobacteraceae bacterium]|nr:alpha/beta fold hydrolase [Steroidobacteraceae bacterium]